MTLPNFLIIGAAKSGTSALWKYLPQHPEVYMSPKKEPHFFAYGNSIPDANGPGDYTKYAKTDLASYEALFDDVVDEKMIGEAATTSLYIPRAADRIQQYIPDAKLIAILRQPADRAYSSFMNLIRDRREPVSDFRQALKLEPARIEDRWGFMWHYTQMGYYYHQVKRFYDRFDPNQLRIYVHDDFEDDPLAIIQDIFRFLEVDDTYEPDISVRANMSGIQKNALLERVTKALFDAPNPVRRVSRKLISKDLRWKVTTKIRNYNLDRKKLPPQLRQELTELYREDILKLQDLIGKDLTRWLNE